MMSMRGLKRFAHGKLEFVPRYVETYDALGKSRKQVADAIMYQKNNPDSSTTVSRNALTKFARYNNYHQKFLDGT